uniref:Uncharacterized protein n=1 Tax=Xenopus tropicalis TaxID=8364 RepID=A0A6I8QYU9_XENTR
STSPGPLGRCASSFLFKKHTMFLVSIPSELRTSWIFCSSVQMSSTSLSVFSYLMLGMGFAASSCASALSQRSKHDIFSSSRKRGGRGKQTWITRSRQFCNDCYEREKKMN